MRIVWELWKHPAQLSEALLAAAKNALLGKLNGCLFFKKGC